MPLTLCAAAAAYPLLWALTARPEPRVDYASRIVALSTAEQPPGENGWPLLEELAAIVRQPAPVASLDQLSYSVVWERRPSVNKAKDVLRAIAWLEAQGAFDVLHDLSRCPNVEPPAALVTDSARYGAVLNALATAVRARAASVYAALARGDEAGAAEAIEDALAGVRALSYQPSGVAATLTVRSLTAVCLNLEAALSDFTIDAAVLARCLAALRSLRPGSCELPVQGDRLAFLDLVQRSYTDDGAGDGRLLPAYISSPEDPENPLKNLGTVGHARRKAIVDAAERYYVLALDFARMTPEARSSQKLFTRPFAAALGPEFKVLTDSLPYWVEYGLTQRDVLMCSVARLQVLIGVHLSERRNARPLASLDALVPDVLPVLPTDLCADVAQLLHAKADGPDGPRHILFEPGPNGVPEQGRGDDVVLIQPTTKGAATMRELAVAGE